MSRWATGDTTGIRFPADPETLAGAGAAFLTEALRTLGGLQSDNRVSRVTRFETVTGGSTGRKALLDIEYERPCSLPDQLFVKFSRDFTDPRRDRGKSQMELEIAFGALSTVSELPIDVPVCVFADYDHESCTGILLTDRVTFGDGHIEPHRDKCRDYLLPDARGHYRALLTAVARLAGTHRAGLLPGDVSDVFRFNQAKVAVGKRIPYTTGQLHAKLEQLTDFCTGHPGLFPDNVRRAQFTHRVRSEGSLIADHEEAIMTWLHHTADHIALCHWNANIDNAWFWSTPDGTVTAGLMDWGCVSVMNVAMALWGCLCSAETSMWDNHLGELLALFAAEYEAFGGPVLDQSLLHDQLVLYAAVMGVAWLLEAPSYVRAAVPDLADVPDRFDPRISEIEPVRAQLLMLTNVLNLWETRDIAALLDRIG